MDFHKFSDISGRKSSLKTLDVHAGHAGNFALHLPDFVEFCHAVTTGVDPGFSNRKGRAGRGRLAQF